MLIQVAGYYANMTFNVKKLQFLTDYSKEDLLPLHIRTLLHIK